MTGTRARPWLPAINQDECDSRAALIDRRAEPGFVPTLLAAIDEHPRTARATVIVWAVAMLGVLALYTVKG